MSLTLYLSSAHSTVCMVKAVHSLLLADFDLEAYLLFQGNSLGHVVRMAYVQAPNGMYAFP